MYQKPNYFFLAFGNNKNYAKDYPVEGGVYPHYKGYIMNSGIELGNVMLLYCCEYYPRHDKEAPGIGVVVDKDIGGEREVIKYQYFPLSHPVDWDTIVASIPELEGSTGFHLKGNLLRKISSSSFRAAIAGRQINWP